MKSGVGRWRGRGGGGGVGDAGSLKDFIYLYIFKFFGLTAQHAGS